MSLIIDASVAFKWIIDEPGSDVARTWLERPELRAPFLVLSEVGNGLQKRVRRGELRADGVAAKLDALPALLDLVDEREAVPRAFELSLSIGHSIYDCVYLALADLMDDELLTADDRFFAKVSGMELGRRVKLLV